MQSSAVLAVSDFPPAPTIPRHPPILLASPAAIFARAREGVGYPDLPFWQIAQALVAVLDSRFPYLEGTRTLREWVCALAPQVKPCDPAHLGNAQLETSALHLPVPASARTQGIAYFIIPPSRVEENLAAYRVAIEYQLAVLTALDIRKQGYAGEPHVVSYLHVSGLFQHLPLPPDWTLWLLHHTIRKAVQESQIDFMGDAGRTLIGYGIDLERHFKTMDLSR